MPRKKTTGVRMIGRGNYAIDLSVEIDGKRVHVYKSGYGTAGEASEDIDNVVAAKRASLLEFASDVPLAKLVEDFAKYREMRGVRQNTITGDVYCLKKHVLTRMPASARKAFTLTEVNRWYSSLVMDDSLTAKRKNYTFASFRRLAEYAWRTRKVIDSNAYTDVMGIVTSVKLGKSSKPAEKETWTEEQEQAFLEAIPKDSQDYPLFRLFCYLGCRLGEFLGLKWDAYDRENGLIEIKRQVVNVAGGAILTEDLKTDDSYRVDELDEGTKEVLDSYMDSRDAHELAGYMFPCPYDPHTPLSRTGFRRKMYDYCDKAGVPHVTPHGVRHCKATRLMGVCENMQEVKSCARFLGHSATMMANVYASVKGVSQRDIMARLKTRK